MDIQTWLLTICGLNSLSFGKHFSVQANWDPQTEKPLQPRLCKRGMLSFNGSCYAVSPIKQNVTAAMSSIGGDAHLASFSSMAEIRQFIASNTARMKEFPYRRPLDLGQPVRLGMFLSATGDAVLSVVSSDGGCQLRPASNSPDGFRVTGRVTGPCLTLSVAEPDRPVLEFGDCSSPMLSLLSFPETGNSMPSSMNCSGSVDIVTNHLMEFGIVNANFSKSYWDSGSNATVSQLENLPPIGTHIRFVIYIAAFMCCIATALWIVGKLCLSIEWRHSNRDRFETAFFI